MYKRIYQYKKAPRKNVKIWSKIYCSINILFLSIILLLNTNVIEGMTPFDLSVNKTKIIIIGGTGAVGSYFAMKLSEDLTNQISILGRPGSKNLEKIKKNGFEFRTSKDVIKIPPIRFHYIGDNYDVIPTQKLIILALKQPEMTEEVAKKISLISGKETFIGVIGNGIPFYLLSGLNLKKQVVDSVDKNGKILAQLVDMNIFCIQPTIASEILEDGVIEIRRPLDEISVILAKRSSTTSDIQLETIQKIFEKSNIRVKTSEDGALKILLEKLQFSISVNTLSALMELSTAEIFEAKDTQVFISYCIVLINSIAKAQNILNMRDYNQFKLLKITPGHFSSLHNDIFKGKPPEIDAIVTATLELSQHIQEQNPNALPSLEPLRLLYILLNKKIKKDVVSSDEISKLFISSSQSLEI